MHISQSKLQGILKSYMKNTVKTKEKSHEPNKLKLNDELKLSEDAQEFSKVLKQATQPDKIRVEKVEELKNQIAKGTYNIDGELVAKKIIDEYFTDTRI